MIQRPSLEQLDRIARAYGLGLGPEDLIEFRNLVSAALASYDRVHDMVEPKPPVTYSRSVGYRPGEEENPLGAWYWKTKVPGASEGKLSGKRIVLKDNVSLAGVPMMNGTSVLEGYVPDVDATIVTRILDAGGEIVGKAVCEHLCFSGSSFTSDTGPVRNPHDPSRSAGGSSSGSAVLVATGDVDMAIGGDQGGSIRIPSSWCGVYGLKPSYGLVPYTGVFPIEQTIDHVGPIAGTVADVALLLEVIAGPDGLDPRQRDLEAKPYSQLLGGDLSGMRIGVVREGFGWEALSEPDVDEAVREAAHAFVQYGASVEEISIPMHRDGLHIWNVIGTEGTLDMMIRGHSQGTNWKGFYQTSLLDVYARGLKTRAVDLTDTVKMVILAAQYMQEMYHGRYYAKAQNLGRQLRAEYDAVLKTYDVLIMPTTPMKATPIPGPESSREERVARALEMIVNTAPFDVTGHPAMNVPCGRSGGLPVGMMLIGRHGEDEVVLRAAYAFEQDRGQI
ncbi:Asp-tRNA(Asn)/Glu-tRNA(Gln) amidotransferase GatCAB subunit A [Kyrpidia spormannii]|uniref:Asp-tRNA(Asn)/Glu-tRNA(Gln) amidotransferase GatCAB subunit A n=1 Tax=Kyrpidia spormannii TaxID=2055160 RepID=A0A2K8N838_9BACL|nr:amidase [Kyrpidia spormannii]ATY84592.1 Asp-tRNA(Asn)/Glu-tRNA(Gln) amidotransferase GatCAB subunit A [Kyrpidia spormannii]